MRKVRQYSIVGDAQHLRQRRDRLKQLRAFCQAARFGSISRAAEQVMSSQPAVSMQIRTLEEELGVLLFERRGPRIALSRIGQRLYQLAMPLVEGMDRLPDAFAEEHYGVVADDLCVGAGQVSAAFLLPKFLKRFREKYPEIRIDVRTGGGQARLDWLRNHELDLVVTAMDIPPDDVRFYPVLESQLVLITPVDHPLAGRESVSFEEAAAYPIVGHTPEHYVRQIGEVITRLHGVASDVVVEVDGWGVITNYVAAGVGIALVPDLCITEHEPIRRVVIENVVPRRKYGVAMRREGPVSLAASRFLEIMIADSPYRSEMQ